MIGVAGCMQDLSCNTDLAEELAALLEGDDHIAIPGNLDVVIPWLGPGLHDWDSVNLDIEYDEGNAFALQFLGKTCMINVIVSGKGVADLAEGHAHPLEVRLHSSEAPWPANVDEQARSARTYNPVVG